MPNLEEPKKISLEKGMYDDAREAGISFGEYLEDADPRDEYLDAKGGKTELSEMTALERQLMAQDIRVAGLNASLVEGFFRTSTSSVLFPEYVSQQVQIGMRQGRLHANAADIIATNTAIDSGSLKGTEIDLDLSQTKQKRVAEGASFPAARFRTKDKSIDLIKIGTKIDASYEAIRRMKVPVLAAALQVLGMQLNRDIVTEAVNVLINGDGNSNPAGTMNTATSGSIVYADVLKLYLAAGQGFEYDNVLAPTAMMEKLLTVAEFRDPLIASDLLTKGKPTTPFGLAMKVATGVPANKVLAFNKTAGIEMIEEKGAQLVEVDKLIDRQIQGSVISKVIGFSKMFRDSAKVLNVVWT